MAPPDPRVAAHGDEVCGGAYVVSVEASGRETGENLFFSLTLCHVRSPHQHPALPAPSCTTPSLQPRGGTQVYGLSCHLGCFVKAAELPESDSNSSGLPQSLLSERPPCPSPSACTPDRVTRQHVAPAGLGDP